MSKKKQLHNAGALLPTGSYDFTVFVIEDISGKPSRHDKAVFVGGEGQPLVRPDRP